jgi:hypothetical protein
MKASCPACGATFSLDTLLGNEGARDAVMAALAMPAPIGKLLVQYLGLFRPAQRQLSFDRVANLLNELLPMISAACIERNGRTWSAPQDYWKQALEEMLGKRDNLTLPLKSHGYLLAIIEGYSSKAEARQESQNEARKGGHTPVGGTSIAASPAVKKQEVAKPKSTMPAHVKAALRKENQDDNS